MAVPLPPTTVVQSTREPRPAYRPGDLVTTAAGYPVLYEVLRLECNGLLRVRGMDWAQGYSAAVRPQEVRPVTHILSP
jgi:hypothetical protein